MHKRHLRPKKKRLGLFYGTIASISIIAFIAIFYFAVLASTKPRSILLVTQKIESALQEKFGQDNVSIDQTYLSFTNYGTLKISISGLRILYPSSEGVGKRSLIIPTLDTEFCLLDLLLMRFEPNKIKVLNPNIFLGDWQKITNQAEINSDQQSDLSLIAGFLSSIRKGSNPIENLEIANAKLTIRNENSDREFLLKKSQIQISNNGKNLVILSQNQLALGEKKADVNLSSNCQISENIICDLSLQNLSPDSISELHPSLKILDKINAPLNANISFSFQNKEFNDIKFKLYATNGDFDFPEFFAEKMHFENFLIGGGYDHKAKILNLSQIETDFVDAKHSTNKPHLNMSLIISELENQTQKMDFDIGLENVPVDQIERFWPIALSQNGIRDWVSKSTSGGLISKASSKFSLIKNQQEIELDDINANLNFAGLNLKYDESFPEITNIYATADFNLKSMKINVSSGEVLQSKISSALVEIDDFNAKKVMLKISGQSSGHAANGLQHANNDPDFLSEVAKYLNGDSKNNFDIRIPLSEEITLKKCYIAVNSSITNLDNDYLQGDLTASSKKDFGRADFATKLDLTKTSFDAHPFSMSKKSGIDSQLSFAVFVGNSDEIHIKNILLTKKETGREIEKFSGNIFFKTSPFLISSANFKNNNFNHANYSLNYTADKNSQKIVVNGDRINLGSFLSDESKSEKTPNLNLQIAANRVDLLNNKSLKNFYLSLQCTNGLCLRGLLKTNYNKQESTNLRIEKTAENNLITGQIDDIGYLAEGLGISKVIVGGDAKVKIEHYAEDNKPIFKGTFTIDNDITIYENETVKRFNKDTLFSQIRDKIFSSEKTTFNSVKLDFQIKDSILDIRSLVANNYKIGITAKGLINLENKDTHLKGMIVPGYIVNSLFGIGNIPIVGGVISGILTGGEGGGLFGIRYQYDKNPGDKEGNFSTNKVTAFVPTTIQNLFE